jgi:hypothetical protein
MVCEQRDRNILPHVGTSSKKYREVLTFVDRFTALHFKVTDAPLAARCIQILLMNQYACWPIIFGMK